MEPDHRPVKYDTRGGSVVPGMRNQEMGYRASRFAINECRRLLRRPRLWLLGAAALGMGALSILRNEFGAGVLGLGGSLGMSLPSLLAIVWPLLAGIGVASSVAEDLRSGYVVAVLS